MQYIVISDSHGRSGAIEEVLYRHPNRDVIFLGDGVRDIEGIEARYPVAFIRVRGNNDFFSPDAQNSLILPLGRRRIFCTHGHEYGVRGGTDGLVYTAKRNDCDAVLYGHTHVQTSFTKEGILLLNPGSLGFGGCYALLTEKDGALIPELKTL